MKNIKTFWFCLLFLFVFQHFGYGQIKTDNGSYSSNLNNLKKEERVIQPLPSYSSLFEPNSRPVAWLNIVTNDETANTLKPINDGIYGQQVVNPVGEQVYIDSDEYPERLCLNTNTMSASLRRIPKGYYTVVGYVGRFDGCYIDEYGDTKRNKQRYQEAIKTQIDLLDQYSFDNEDEKDWAHVIFVKDSKLSDVKGWAEWYRKEKRYYESENDAINAMLEQYNDAGLEKIDIYRHIFRSSFFILEDQDGNRYYDYSGNLISVSCYEKISELLLNKTVIVEEMQEKDFLTGEKLNSDIACQDNIEFYCKDIFLRDGVLIGVFSRDDGEITLRLTGYTNKSFSEVGEKGVVTIGGFSCVNHGQYDNLGCVYPKCYIDQINSMRKMEAQKRKALEQNRQRDIEKAKEQRKKEILAKYGEKWGNLILNRKVAVGMTEEMCRESVGYPTNRFTKTTAVGKSEVWSYTNYNATMWLYFNDGVIYKIEDYR